MTQVTAIVLAAGKGQRMGLGFNKVYAQLKGRPVLSYSLELLENAEEIQQIIVVAAPGELDEAKQVVAWWNITKAKNIVEGGTTRFRSVAAALPYISCKSQLVAVHDGARPLLTMEDLQAVLAAASKGQGAILAAPMQDTVKQAELFSKEVREKTGLVGTVACTIDRDTLWRAMTPQVFPVELFLEAYTSMDKNVTDDAALMEAIGAAVTIVEGRTDNIKITTPVDLHLAELLLKERSV